jgi:hypothetical protein
MKLDSESVEKKLEKLKNSRQIAAIRIAATFGAARVFWVQHTKTGKNEPNFLKKIPNDPKIYKNGRKIDQMS